jgi:hypothetical protein
MLGNRKPGPYATIVATPADLAQQHGCVQSYRAGLLKSIA